MRSTGCSGVGGVLNTYPVRPHLLGQSPAIAQHLARGRASARGAQLCSPEGKHEHIPEEREGFLRSPAWRCGVPRARDGAARAGTRGPCCLPSIITVNQQHAGHGCRPRHRRLLGGSRGATRGSWCQCEPSWALHGWQRAGAAEGRHWPCPALQPKERRSSREATGSKEMDTHVHLQVNLLQREKQWLWLN